MFKTNWKRDAEGYKMRPIIVEDFKLLHSNYLEHNQQQNRVLQCKTEQNKSDHFLFSFSKMCVHFNLLVRRYETFE
jgi:hypothetical protein